jgi:hypothetical protein
MGARTAAAHQFQSGQQRQGESHALGLPRVSANAAVPQQWLFDSPTSIPRLLKFRGGHHAPPALIRYYGDDGKQILTAGKDRALRYTSVVRDSRSHELSQGSSHRYFECYGCTC